MNSTTSLLRRSLALAAAGLLFAAAPAWAKGHDDEGHGHGHGHGKKDKHAKHEVVRQVTVGSYFQEPQRVYVREYYGAQVRAGRCPPGLAKKNNGCMPPGQAKKWREGERLRVAYTAVPQPVIARLPPSPPGYRYVRVDSDILLIALGTLMVVDGIQGLGN